MTGPGFVHLHVHSSYSLLEGAMTIGKLAELAKADRQPALALTDSDNMFGALEFSDKMAAAGIQPIIGCALAVDFGDLDAGPRSAAMGTAELPRIVLLAAREEGYLRLMRLVSRAYLGTPAGARPHLELAALRGETQGLLALTGGPSGPLDRAIAAGQGELAAARLQTLLELFGDGLYVELQRHGTEPERHAEPLLIELASNERDRKLMTFVSAETAISRALVTTPGVSAERVAALRRAFDATMKDPQFLAEADKAKMDISPMTGEDSQVIADQIANTPADVIAYAQEILGDLLR